MDVKRIFLNLSKSVLVTFLVTLLLLTSSRYGKGAEKVGMEEPFDITVAFTSRSFVEAETEEMKAHAKTLTNMLLRKKIGGTIESIVYEDMSSLEKAMMAKKIDVLSLLSDEYFDIRNHIPLDPVAVTARQGGAYEEIGIWVRRDSGIKNLIDLRKKRITVQKGLYGSVLRSWVETLLMKEGVYDGGDLFLSMKKVAKPSHAILPVFFKQADVCIAVKNSFEVATELNPQIAKELELLVQTPKTIGGIICFRPDYPQKQKEIIKKTLWSLHEETEGKQLFTLFRIDKFLPFHSEYLKNMETILLEYKELKIKMAKGK